MVPNFKWVIPPAKNPMCMHTSRNEVRQELHKQQVQSG